MLTAAQVRRISDSGVFASTRSPYLVVDDELTIRAVNPAYLAATGRTREALLGAPMFEAFPSNTADPADDGARRLAESFTSVFSAGTRHHMGIQRYDIPRDDEPSEFIFKVWAPVNSPLRDGDRTIAVMHHIEDATALFSRLSGSPEAVSDEAARSTPPTRDTCDEWLRLVSAFREACEDNGELQARCEQLAAALDNHPRIGAAVRVLTGKAGISQLEASRALFRPLDERIAETRVRLRHSRAALDRSQALLDRYEATSDGADSAANDEQAKIGREIRQSTWTRPPE